MWKNKHIRDLAWILKSAPILENPGSELRDKWCESQFSKNLFEEHLPWLEILDQSGDTVNQALQGMEDLLLGKHYEKLFKFLLSNSPYFELKAANIQLIRNGVTDAEIDFLAKHLTTGNWIHFEISCKYYLGETNTSKLEAWIGPNGNDNLGERMKKFKRQLSIQETIQDQVVTDEMRSFKTQSLGWLKGFLFVPYHLIGNHKLPKGVSSLCPVGWYIKSSNIHIFRDSPAQWLILPRHEWISPWEGDADEYKIMKGLDLCLYLEKHFINSKRAILIIQLDPLSNYSKELSRGFVVDKNWPNSE